MTKLTPEQQKYLEGYAAALQDLQLSLTGDNWCSKSYDPLTCEAEVMHSYAFDMKDGGRHHKVRDYQTMEDIKKVLLEETSQAINQHQQLKQV
jgi:hypothetical protein